MKTKPSNRQGEETRKNHLRRLIPYGRSDYDTYFYGKGLDIGYRGYLKEIEPITEGAIGVDTDYPGYNGQDLPFASESMDFVHASHVLEHVDDYVKALQEWHRVLKVGGYMIINVPHRDLYEKRWAKPSRWNKDHKRFYTPASLLREIEVSLPVNSYRVRRLIDNDLGFDYDRGPELHSSGSYEIELILQKIRQPQWELS